MPKKGDLSCDFWWGVYVPVSMGVDQKKILGVLTAIASIGNY